MSGPKYLALLLLLSSSNGCTRCGDQKGIPDGTADASSAGNAGAPKDWDGHAGNAGSPNASHTGKVGISTRLLPEGAAPNGAWTEAFTLGQFAGDENLTWIEASSHCLGNGKALCLETQWQRACASDPAIGRIASWTLSVSGSKAIVRGGADGCSARELRRFEERELQRIGLCCDRAILVTGNDLPEDLRKSAHQRLLELELTLREGTSEKLSKILAERLSVDGIELERDAAVARLSEGRKAEFGTYAFYDHCRLMLVPSDDAQQSLIADCSLLRGGQGSPGSAPQRIVFAGPTGPVVYVGDPKLMKRKEHKERVKAFLPSE